jgi:hypothetical protein
MRDHERFSRDLTDHESIPSGSVDAPVAPHLSLADWDALPLSVRASDKLVDMLLAIHAIEADLSRDEAAPLRWIAPEIRAVRTTVCGVLQQLAS